LKVLYIDEAGCLGALPSSTSNIQPVFVFIAVAFDVSHIGDLTRDFLALKRRFFPDMHTSQHHLDDILAEIKGADIRRNAACGSRRSKRAALGFLDNLFTLIEQYGAELFGRLWIKGIGKPFNGRSVYTFSMQDTCSTFQRLLAQTKEQGFIIADSRNKPANTNVSHSVFTRKFQANGDTFPNLVEMPAFGHSDNHAGIQIADLLCSAVVFPMAVQTYCRGHITSVHTRDYASLKARYGERLRVLQFRYQDMTDHRSRGGITVSDAVASRGGGELFQ
jgi:hypothetical protein